MDAGPGLADQSRGRWTPAHHHCFDRGEVCLIERWVSQHERDLRRNAPECGNLEFSDAAGLLPARHGRIERCWVLPFLRFPASLVVGPRWARARAGHRYGRPLPTRRPRHIG